MGTVISVVLLSIVILTSLIPHLLRSRCVRFREIPGPPRGSFFKGNLTLLVHRHGGEWMKTLVDSYGGVSKLSAPLGGTLLHIYDTKALRSICIKDQDVWLKSSTGSKINHLLLGPGLLTTQGRQHRKQRKMLTPVFSVAHLRSVTPIFYEVTYKLRDALKAKLSKDAKDLDIVHWTGRAALEVLGQGALGYSLDPLVDEASDDFADTIKSYFTALDQPAILYTIVKPLVGVGPAWIRRKIVDMLPSTRVQRIKRIVDTMYKRSVEIVNQKRTLLARGDDAVLQDVAAGKDVMSVLLRANQEVSENDRLTDEELIAQISTFLQAGLNTTSNTVCRILHLLSLNSSVQEKLRREIVEAQAGTEISYDTLMDLPYLDAVWRESLRLYGPVRLLVRRAAEDTVLPLHGPIRSTNGSMLSELVVPKGTEVMLNIWACNTNKGLWGDDALEWKPERWLAPLPQALEEARIPGIYSNLMSFGGGGRSCIGFKYAELELKVMLSVLLANFKFELTDTPIVWNLVGVAYPSVDKQSTKPEMPLKVTTIAV